MSQLAPTTPTEVTDLEARAQRYETPCGEGTMVWRTWGSGPPLLLLHGSHGSWLHWIRTIPSLAERYQLWVPDLPGYGESAPPPVVDSPASHADAIAAGLDRLVGGPVDVVAFSLGSLIGSNLAASRPDLVRRMIVVDAGGMGTPMPAVELTTVRGLEGEAQRAAHRSNLRAMMFHDEANIDDFAMWFQSTVPRPTSRVHFEVIPDKMLVALRRVPVQLDLIWAENDDIHPDPDLHASVLREIQPDAELRVVAGSGHWAMYEGADDFNRHVHDLLELPLRTANQPESA